MVGLILAAALGGQDWEYRQGIGFVDNATMDRKSPEEFLQHGLELRRQGAPGAAVRVFNLILENVRDPALRETAHFERAQTFYEARLYFDAYHEFEAFILRHPQSDRAQTAKRMEMTSALELARVGHKTKFLGLPFFSTSKTGVEYLRDALKRYPREDFSADFSQKLGMFFYDRGEYDSAQVEFSMIVGDPDEGMQAQYPDAPEAVLALYMLGRTFEKRFEGISYDIKPLKRAKRHYERFVEEADRLRRLPPPARDWVDTFYQPVLERIAWINERMAEKELASAEYYDWRGLPRSAAVSYRAILLYYPQTQAARRAREWLKGRGEALPPARVKAPEGNK